HALRRAVSRMALKPCDSFDDDVVGAHKAPADLGLLAQKLGEGLRRAGDDGEAAAHEPLLRRRVGKRAHYLAIQARDDVLWCAAGHEQAEEGLRLQAGYSLRDRWQIGNAAERSAASTAR